MKIGLRFFASWLLASVVMFVLFYVWHGIFLNDFRRLNFPLTWFIVFAAISYLIFGAGIYFLFESRLMKRFDNLLLRAVLTGTIAGIALTMISTVINISITKHLSKDYLMMDFVWQIGEQSVGALVVVALKYVIREPNLETVKS